MDDKIVDSTAESKKRGAMTKAARPTSSTTCHLLGLPAELRNRIWEQVIVNETSICLFPVHWYESEADLETGAQPPLTRTCSQIRGETLSMFYATNTFRIHTWNIGIHCSGQDGPSLLRSLLGHTQKLRHLEIQICPHNNFLKLVIDSTKNTFAVWVVREGDDDPGFGECAMTENDDGLECAEQFLEDISTQQRDTCGLRGSELLALARFLQL